VHQYLGENIGGMKGGYHAARRLYGFGPTSNWPALAPFVTGRPDERLIVNRRQEVPPQNS
jgi:hypothetical protein